MSICPKCCKKIHGANKRKVLYGKKGRKHKTYIHKEC